MASEDTEFDLTMRLFGPPRLRGKLVSWASVRGDPELMAALEMALNAIGQSWELDVKAAFAEKHGRSGDTERSISGEAEIEPPFMAYRIHIGGNIGFVLNPLPDHDIAARIKPALGAEDPDTPAQGRSANFHPPFGPRKNVFWYQGGSDSHSPDPDFYKGTNASLLYKTEVAAHKLANDIQILWGEAGAEEEEWSRSTARIIWRQTHVGRG
jgi:hypothetical protein